ncbi:MAG: carbonic anhydrase [Candidatus Krumholzibacteriota bacterium]|nr:carbonic anhydrase [Candidatus Krumholzibacteriota bacterium]
MSTENQEQALERLAEGNTRFVAGKPLAPHRSGRRRRETAEAQKPFAIILTCADSRVCPELIFDRGIGDLFVVRVAGNVLDDLTLGSIEYAAEHLGVALLLVLGHTNCGAVKAAIEQEEAPGHTGSFIDFIRPAVAKAKVMEGNLCFDSVLANIGRVVEQLKSTGPVLDDLCRNGKLRVIGGCYDLASGAVKILP